MNKYFIGLILGVIVTKFSCATNNLVESSSIDKLAEINNYVKQYQTAKQSSQLCLIYDLDNTILTQEPKLGSDAWTQWNISLESQDLHKLENWGISHNLYSLEGALRFFMLYKPTESTTVDIINQLKDVQHHPSIVMTARSFERYFAATENQLAHNNLDFKTNPIGISPSSKDQLLLQPNKHATGYKAYIDGVYYSADDNKGEEIAQLIQQQRKITKNNNLCQTLIFVDNSLTNARNVYNKFKQSNPAKIHVISLRYSAYDQYNKVSESSLKDWDYQAKNSTAQTLFKLIKQLN
ncbi:MAG: hypothetical protein RLZZ293_86 [Pseudomonadota bacterium]|jgi:hypothetical protein